MAVSRTLCALLLALALSASFLLQGSISISSQTTVAKATSGLLNITSSVVNLLVNNTSKASTVSYPASVVSGTAKATAATGTASTTATSATAAKTTAATGISATASKLNATTAKTVAAATTSDAGKSGSSSATTASTPAATSATAAKTAATTTAAAKTAGTADTAAATDTAAAATKTSATVSTVAPATSEAPAASTASPAAVSASAASGMEIVNPLESLGTVAAALEPVSSNSLIGARIAPGEIYFIGLSKDANEPLSYTVSVVPSGTQIIYQDESGNWFEKRLSQVRLTYATQHEALAAYSAIRAFAKDGTAGSYFRFYTFMCYLSGNDAIECAVDDSSSLSGIALSEVVR